MMTKAKGKARASSERALFSGAMLIGRNVELQDLTPAFPFDAIWALEGFDRSPEAKRFDDALIAGDMTTSQVLEIFLAEARASATKSNS